MTDALVRALYWMPTIVAALLMAVVLSGAKMKAFSWGHPANRPLFSVRMRQLARTTAITAAVFALGFGAQVVVASFFDRP
jgi:hypothetical protein